MDTCCNESDVLFTKDQKCVESRVICMFGERKSCVSQGHYNLLCSHHSCCIFMSDDLFCWIEFLGKHLGPVYELCNTGIESIFQ